MATGFPSAQPAGNSPTAPISANVPPPAPAVSNPLGFQQASLAGITVDDLLKNKAALTMFLHYYHQLHDENGALKNDLNTATTYVTGYQTKKIKTRTGAVLQALAAIPLGFSINILTGGNQALTAAGWTILAIGVVLQVMGLFFAFWGET